MIPDFTKAVDRIAEVVMFENWLRFYFIAEENDTLVLRLPEKAMEQLRKRYPGFYGLAEYLNNEEITHRSSMDAVCLFVAREMEGAVLPESVIGRVFDSPQFQVELQLFGSWVQSHEEQLDENFMEFSDWLSLFTAWKESDEVKQYAKRLAESMPLPASSTSTTTQ